MLIFLPAFAAIIPAPPGTTDTDTEFAQLLSRNVAVASGPAFPISEAPAALDQALTANSIIAAFQADKAT